MKTKRNAATTPGSGERQRDSPERLQPARAEVARRLEQPPVEALERDEDRQRDERQPDVAEHEHDREPAVEELRDRVVGRAEPVQKRKELTTPWLPRITFQASTRSR